MDQQRDLRQLLPAMYQQQDLRPQLQSLIEDLTEEYQQRDLRLKSQSLQSKKE